MHDVFVQTAVNVSGDVRTETLHGVPHRVVPATLVRPQVLVNNIGRCLLPPEAITADWARTANGSPVLTDHPTRNGAEVSGRAPDVLNSLGIGFLFDVRVDNGDLKGEVWLNESRAESVPDLKVILEKLDNDETPELSTGFPAMGQRKRGVYNGARHDFVIYPEGFDHLAVFAEKTGACSVNDGCGLGVNEDAEDGDDLPDGLGRKILGFLRSLVDNELSLDEIRKLVRDAAETRWGGSNVFVYVPELYDATAIVSVEPQGSEDVLYRVPYTVDDEERSVELGEAVEVEKVTEFVPVENGSGLVVRHEYLTRNPTPREGDMTRKELINRLCNCSDVPFERDALDAMSDEELAFLGNQAAVEDGVAEGTGEGPEGASGREEEEEEGAGAEGASPEGEGAAAAENAEAEPPAWARGIVDSVENLGRRLTRLEEETEPARNQVEEERKRLVGEIAANSDFEESELEGKPLPELRKIHNATARSRTYVGLGAPRKSNPGGGGVDIGFTPADISVPASHRKEN